MEKMPVKAKHYKDTVYHEPCNCGLSNAARDFFKKPYASEGVRRLCVGEGPTVVEYKHKEYSPDNYSKHREEAQSHGWDDTVITTINLEKTNE